MKVYARSLTGTEHRSCMDLAESALPGMRLGALVVALMHKAMWTDTGPVFRSREFIEGYMGGREISLIGGQVLAGLNVVSPYYSESDWEGWQYAFRNGARESGNISAALSLGQCFEDTCNFPERYFDVPRHELTDGQWMLYWGARSLIDDMRKKK